jgi:predicted dehydrogenase
MEIGKIGIGIFGFGNISPFHIKSIEELDNCELIAVQSSSAEKRELIKSKYKVSACESTEEIMGLDQIQLIIICTPSGFHLEPAMAAMKAGKHVVIEKPLEVTTARCREMIQMSKEQNVSLSCIFQNRYALDFQKVKDAVDSGQLGKILLGRVSVNWKRDQDQSGNT